MSLVYVTRVIPTSGIDLLREAGHQVDISPKDGVLTNDELKAALSAKPYEALLSLLTDTIDEEVLSVAPNLKVIANYAVGYNNIDLTATQKRGIVVTNTPGVLTDSVAEFTVALLLSVVKRIPSSDAFTRQGNFVGWAPELYLGGDLEGRTLGIVGAGRIGAGVASRLHHGFGMKVIYTDIQPSPALEASVPAEFRAELDDLLKGSDVVSLHVPLTDGTHHLINAERLSLMKPSAYLINTSRGPVIDEEALVLALKQGTIAGAGLDVFENEPQLATDLATLQNAVLTPHIASASTNTRTQMSCLAAENIIAVCSGQPAQNHVTS